MFDGTTFATFQADLLADFVVILPIALGIMVTLWGVRIAISYLKGIAY